MSKEGRGHFDFISRLLKVLEFSIPPIFQAEKVRCGGGYPLQLISGHYLAVVRQRKNIEAVEIIKVNHFKHYKIRAQTSNYHSFSEQNINVF